MRLKDENADLKRRLEELEEKHKCANRQFRNVISDNVISNNCSPFSHRLHPRTLQTAEIGIERLIGKETEKTYLSSTQIETQIFAGMQINILKCHFEQCNFE